MVYFCYLIRSQANPNYTYIGITNNTDQRILKHNGILKGGAKATRKFNDWYYSIIIQLPTKNIAASFEWKWKHYFSKNNKWLHTKSGINNKIKRLREVMIIFPNAIVEKNITTFII